MEDLIVLYVVQYVNLDITETSVSIATALTIQFLVSMALSIQKMERELIVKVPKIVCKQLAKSSGLSKTILL